jgi:hypothetical protein
MTWPQQYVNPFPLPIAVLARPAPKLPQRTQTLFMIEAARGPVHGPRGPFGVEIGQRAGERETR